MQLDAPLQMLVTNLDYDEHKGEHSTAQHGTDCGDSQACIYRPRATLAALAC